LNTNPKNGRLTLRESALIAFLLALAKVFTIFMPLYTVGVIKTDPFSFIYALVQCIGAGFFTDFLLLSGLNSYYKKQNNKGSG
jgi:hypothetical protein